MGVNISVRRVTSRNTDVSQFGDIVYYETEEQNWFDTLRYSGDRSFILDNEFYFIDSDLPHIEQRLARPVDFDKARKYVYSFILKGNQQRLLEALDRMENDEKLCFTWSW